MQPEESREDFLARAYEAWMRSQGATGFETWNGDVTKLCNTPDAELQSWFWDRAGKLYDEGCRDLERVLKS